MKKHGGIWFLKLGRMRLSFCIARRTFVAESRETRTALRDLAVDQRALAGDLRALVRRIDALIEQRGNGSQGRP